MTRITRRRFLGVALGLGGGAAVMSLRPWRAVVRFVEPTPAARLVGLLGDPESAGVVGAGYLRVRGATSEGELVDEIAARLPGGRTTIEISGQDELRARLAEAVRDDFAADRVVDVEGWVLSGTEARLYAIAAMR